ncbi:MAG TPA: transcriptional regulator, partial [Verrucomicrobiales bacterium]|nr:transcriptional regulator [Verrucomicrobiales bacterium]
MPIYEFKCGNCKKDHEILVRSHNWSGTPCPACGANQLQKKL